MIQVLIVVALSSNFYTLSTVLFHKYGGANVGVTNCMSHFSIFVPTKANFKLSNGNTVHAQVIGVISCHFLNYPVINPVVLVYYYYPGYRSNTISFVAKTFYVGLLKVASEPILYCGCVDTQGRTLRSPYHTWKILFYL